jgi:8-oxo-dGTP pyrophosphatase MutT (NUDIX family)
MAGDQLQKEQTAAEDDSPPKPPHGSDLRLRPGHALFPRGPASATPQLALPASAAEVPASAARAAALAAARAAWLPDAGPSPAADRLAAGFDRGWAAAREEGMLVAAPAWPWLLAPGAALARIGDAAAAPGAEHVPADALGTGVVLLDARGRVLLLRRAGRDSWPGRWEVPGGGVDGEGHEGGGDASVLAGAARELLEESGLLGAAFVGVVDPAGRAFKTRSGLRVRRFSFVALLGEEQEVTVAGPGGRVGWVPVTVNPREHQDWIWATEEEVAVARFDDKKLVFTSEAEQNDILAVFKVFRDSTKVVPN